MKPSQRSSIDGMATKLSATVTFPLALCLLFNAMAIRGELQFGFYDGKCNGTDVEAAVRRIAFVSFLYDPTLVAALLRMQFHDCFVRGCDASILLDGSSSEKTAPPNLSVRGYDLIDEVKTELEAACPGVVSCADIIVMATRDAVAFGGGRLYEVETGRKDGTVSLATAVNLPGPSISVSQSIAVFGSKGLNVSDMVLLLGGHTVGITHCSFIMNRLYNFNGTAAADPSMSSMLVAVLRLRCPRNSTANNMVYLDQGAFSAYKVDNSYYRQLLMNRGILPIDQSLALDPATSSLVRSFAGVGGFWGFGSAMVKLGAVDVLTGEQGEVGRSGGLVASPTRTEF